MPDKLLVLGTFDQPIASLLEVDLMQCLTSAGVTPGVIVFKRSNPAARPQFPVDHAIEGSRCAAIEVNDFNAPETIARIRALGPDLMVYAGGRDLLRPPLLESARLGCLGGHYGRLPAIRGMGTVEWSVIEGVAPTVAIQNISPGIDTGDVVMQSAVPLVAGDNFTSIRDRSYFMTKVMLALAARRVLIDGVTGRPQAQEEGRQYYRLHPSLEERARRALTRVLSGRAS